MVSTASLHPATHPTARKPAVVVGERLESKETATASRLAYSFQNLLSAAPLIAGDLVSVCLASVVAYTSLSFLHSPHAISLASLALSSSLAVLVAFALLDLYPACGMSPAVEFRQVITGVTLVGIGCVLANLSQHAVPLWTALCFGMWGLTAAALIPMSRSTVRSWFSRFEWWRQPVLIVGSAEFCQQVGCSIGDDRRAGLRPIEFVLQESIDTTDDSSHTSVEQIAAMARQHGAYRAILSTLSIRVGEAADGGLPVPHLHLLSHGSSATPMLWGRTTERNGWPELECQNRLLVPSSAFCKRGMDLIVTFLALPMLMPLLLVLAAIVRLSSPGPVFYSQRRLGRDAQPFDAVVIKIDFWVIRGIKRRINERNVGQER